MMLLLLIWGGLVILRVPGAYFIVSILYFIVLPYMNEGRTVGSWIVRIRISGEESI